MCSQSPARAPAGRRSASRSWRSRRSGTCRWRRPAASRLTTAMRSPGTTRWPGPARRPPSVDVATAAVCPNASLESPTEEVGVGARLAPSATAEFIGPPADSASQVELKVPRSVPPIGTRSIRSLSAHHEARDGGATVRRPARHEPGVGRHGHGFLRDARGQCRPRDSGDRARSLIAVQQSGHRVCGSSRPSRSVQQF